MEAGEEEDVIALFKKMGISRPPGEGDGYEIVKKKHARDPHGRFAGDDVTSGPLQVMMNNGEFRKSLGDWLAGSRLPYAAFDRQLTIEADRTWNAADLTAELKKIALDRAGLDDDGFYATVSYVHVEAGEKVADVHWIGLEFKRRTVSERIAVFDPGRGGEGPTTYPGAEPVSYGLLLPLLSDEEVAVALEWADVPTRPWGDFEGREIALSVAERMILERRDVDVRRGVKLNEVLARLGAVLFNPMRTPCQVDTTDYFCQTWVMYLFEQRSGLGKSRERMERDLDALRGDRCKIKWLVLDFVRRVVRSDVARDYWIARSVKRGKTVSTEGKDMYDWLLWAVDRPEFGETFACEMSHVTLRRDRRRDVELL